jgi:polyhydroxybutyrate depolymerase
VYLTGFSNGGFMTTQLARWRPTAFRAAAPQSSGTPAGTVPSDYAPPSYCVATTGAVPVLIIHGLGDTIVDPTLAEENASYWDMADHCDQSAEDCSSNGDVLAAPPITPTIAVDPAPCVSSTGCAAATSVSLCLIPGMGHEIWSAAPSAIWSFFAAHGARR